MSYKAISENLNITVLLIICFGLLIWIPSFFIYDNSVLSLSTSQMPLYKAVSQLLARRDILVKIIAYLLVLTQSIFICGINIRFVLIQKRTFLPAFLYFILTGYLPQLHNLNEVLIASVFINIILGILMSSYEAEPNSYNFFNVGIILGLGMMFYAPLLYFLVFIWISTAILRSFRWREYVFPVLGLLVPFIFYFTYLFLNDLDLYKSVKLIGYELFRGFPNLFIKWPAKLFTVYSAVIIVISSIYMLRVFQFRKVYIRRYFILLFSLFMLSLIVFSLFSGFNPGMIYIIAIPVVFLITNFFTTGKDTWFKKALLALLIILSLFAVASESFM